MCDSPRDGRDPYVTDNPLHLQYHARNEALGRMRGQIRIRVRYEDLATPCFDYLFVSIDELLILLSGTEWMLEEYKQDGPTSPHMNVGTSGAPTFTTVALGAPYAFGRPSYDRSGMRRNER